MKPSASRVSDPAAGAARPCEPPPTATTHNTANQKHSNDAAMIVPVAVDPRAARSPKALGLTGGDSQANPTATAAKLARNVAVASGSTGGTPSTPNNSRPAILLTP